MGQGVQCEEGERRRSTPAVASAVSRRGGRAHPTRWRLSPPGDIPEHLRKPRISTSARDWLSRQERSLTLAQARWNAYTWTPAQPQDLADACGGVTGHNQ